VCYNFSYRKCKNESSSSWFDLFKYWRRINEKYFANFTSRKIKKCLGWRTHINFFMEDSGFKDGEDSAGFSEALLSLYHIEGSTSHKTAVCIVIDSEPQTSHLGTFICPQERTLLSGNQRTNRQQCEEGLPPMETTGKARRCMTARGVRRQWRRRPLGGWLTCWNHTPSAWFESPLAVVVVRKLL